nr:ParB/RepB/Spo0J family partition protein [uncultured Rhodopila sp.]
MTKITLNTETFTVPLDKLEPDERNVRLTGREIDVPELAHNIAHEGLLHGLGVRPVLNDSGEPTGRYGVVIGGRRLAALKLLVKKQRLAKDEPVTCFAVKPAALTSAGLAENLQRVPMHPADAYVAFARMSGEGLCDAEIAVRFGLSPTTVQKRLRLGRLSPALLDALRANRISEPVAQAFAITDDVEAQDRIFAKVQGRAWIDPAVVRAMLTEGEVPSHDRRVALIGLAAYEQAGGGVRRDLFADDAGGGVTLTDPGLLDRLVLEKLAAEGDRLRADGWQDVSVSMMPPEDIRGFYAAPFDREPLSEDADRRLTELSEQYDALVEQGEAEGLTDEEEERLDAIQAEITAIEAATETYSDATKTAGRAFVFLGDGGLRVVRGLPRAGLAQTADETGIDDDGEPGANGGVSAPDHPAIKKPELSATLTAELQAHRTAALQARVAQMPDLALRLVVHSLLLCRSHGGYRTVAKISGYEPNLQQACRTIDDTEAVRMVSEMHDRRGDAEPGDHADLLPWLLSLDNGEVLTVLAPLVASTVDAGCEDWSQGADRSLAAGVAAAARLDMTEWWTPTVETYFGRVTKAQIGLAVTEAGAGPFNTEGKKAEVAAAAARLVAGTGWLPAMLRSPPEGNGNAERSPA